MPKATRSRVPQQAGGAVPGGGLLNLGPASKRWLAQIGVHTLDDLRRRGALTASVEIHRSRSGVSLNLLYALVGALERTATGSTRSANNGWSWR